MADELIHLVEYAKGLDDPNAAGMIMQFGGYSDIIQSMPFKSAPGGRNIFQRETAQPTINFRGVNADPEISHGETEELQDQCYPLSGLLEVDRVLVNRHGTRKQNMFKLQQMESAAAKWTDTIITGDNAATPTEFSGLQTRLVADSAGNVDGSTDDSRLIANATGSGGGALSLAQLDLAISLVNKPNQIWMSRDLWVKMRAAARSTSVSNNSINFDSIDSDLGREVMRYQGIPIFTGYPPSKRSRFLPYTEVAYGGGGAVTTSIYVCSVREDGVCGINTRPPEVIDVGNTDRGVHMRDLYEWDAGITQEDFYSAIRLSSITNAAITA